LLLSKGLEESESRCDVGKLALHEVLQLDHQLVMAVEHLETAEPVFEAQECLFVRVELGKDLLQELLSHVKATETLVFSNELGKSCEINFVCVLRGIQETFFDAKILFRNV